MVAESSVVIFKILFICFALFNLCGSVPNTTPTILRPEEQNRVHAAYSNEGNIKTTDYAQISKNVSEFKKSKVIDNRLNCTAVPLSDTMYEVKWTDKTQYLADHYRVYTSSRSTYLSAREHSSSLTVTGASPNTSYTAYVRLCQDYNCFNNVDSENCSVRTYDESLTCTAEPLSDTKFKVNWTERTLYYDYEFRVSVSSFSTYFYTNGSTSSLTVANASSNNYYSVYVRLYPDSLSNNYVDSAYCSVKTYSESPDVYDIKLISPGNVSVECSYYGDYRIESYKIRTQSNDECVMSSGMKSCTISGLSSGVNYTFCTYSCVGSNCWHSEDSRCLSRVLQWTGPNVTDVKIKSATSLTAECSSVSPSTIKVEHYKIYANGCSNHCNTTKYDRSCTIEGLSTYNTYTICAMACSQTKCWQSFDSKCADPFKLVPIKVEAKVLSDTELEVDWIYYGQAYTYEFRAYALGSSGGYCITTSYSCDISNLLPYTEYKVYVRACTTHDCSQFYDSDYLSIYTGSRSPDMKSLIPKTSYELVVSFSPLTISHPNITEYRMYIKESPSSYCETTAESRECKISIGSRPKNYTVCTMACMNNICWHSSKSICLSKIETPVNIRVQLVGVNYMEFHWESEHNIQYYTTIDYIESGYPKTISSTLWKPYQKFAYPEPCSEYTFSVRACKNPYHCSAMNSLSIYPYTAEIEKIFISRTYASGILVGWDVPDKLMRCPFKGYTAKAEPLIPNSALRNGNCTVDKHERCCTITHLFSDIEYKVYVHINTKSGTIYTTNWIKAKTSNNANLKITLPSGLIQLILIIAMGV